MLPLAIFCFRYSWSCPAHCQFISQIPLTPFPSSRNKIQSDWGEDSQTAPNREGCNYKLLKTRAHVNCTLWVRSFGRILKRICDLRTFGSWCIKGTDESLSRVDSSVPLMHHDPNDMRSQIHFWILPKKHTI